GSPTWETGMWVRAARMFGISLRWSGSRCTTTTKAAPVFSGNALNSNCNARTPPAEAPIPTTTGEGAPGPGISLSSWSPNSAITQSNLFYPARDRRTDVSTSLAIKDRFGGDFRNQRRSGGFELNHRGDMENCMAHRDILAIGTSAGGFDALRFLA